MANKPAGPLWADTFPPELQDLTLTANIIDLSVQRGAFKGAEAEQVGQMFNRLVAIIKSITPVVDEEAAPAAETEGKG